MNVEAKTVDESRVETVHIVRPNHLNGANRLFGGILMQWIDEVAGIVAKRHSMSNVTTASVDNLAFQAPAFANDTVVLEGRITCVGTSSMEVRVDTFVEALGGTRHQVNRAYLVMVALNKNQKPVKVPQLILETEEDKAEWDAGMRRRALRNLRQKENY